MNTSTTACKAQDLTRAQQDYLVSIYRLVRNEPHTRVRDIARERSVKAGSVSPALRRLAELGLVRYIRREYVTLTDAGVREGRWLLARHHMLVRFMEEILGMPAETARSEAQALEHGLSEVSVDHLTRLLEFLRICPLPSADLRTTFLHCPAVHEDGEGCGHPCPHLDDADGTEETPTMSLFDLTPGQRGKVLHVKARGAIRQRLLDMGVLPDVVVEVERFAPAGHPVWVRLLGSQIALRREEAQSVQVVAV